MAKSEALKHLETLAFERLRERYPNTPVQYLPNERFSDLTANQLTKSILTWLRLNGWQAERIACTGRYIDQTKVVSDVIGNQRRIGSGKWIAPSMQPGTADISAIIGGRSVKIEVKVGRDRQSEAQKAYQKQIEQAGGVYWIATSFENFLQQYMELV